MATKVWVGGAISTAQVDTLTVGASVNGSTYTVTIANKSITYTATAADNTAAATALAALLAASAEPEFQEILWTSAGAAITGTGLPDGTPFTLTATPGGSGTPTFTRATTAAPVSPNDYATAANWNPAGVPVAGDDVIVAGADRPAVKYGLNQSAVALASFYTKGVEIGLPERNPLDYSEYRGTHLRLSVTGNITVDGDSGRVKLDAGISQATLNVTDTGTPLEGGLPALLFRGTNSSNAAKVTDGAVGFGYLPGDSCTLGLLSVGGGAGGGGPQVKGGTALSLTNLTQLGGAVELNALINIAVGTVIKSDGTLTVNGTGTGGTIYNDGGDLFWNAGNITTTVKTSDGGRTDFTRSPKPRTVAGCVLESGAVLAFDINTTTFTGTPKILLNRCSLSDVRIETGNHIGLDIAAGP